MENKRKVLTKIAVIIVIVAATAMAVHYIVKYSGSSEQNEPRDINNSAMVTEVSDTLEESEETESQADKDGVDSYTDISPQEAYDLITENPEVIVIDVSPKFDEGHLPGAVNYYIGDGSLDEAIPSLDKSATYLVYCHVDSASISGAQKLIDAGFEEVYRLEGNYSAWVDAGFPIE
ncbi:hypothetical protein GF357_01565 [Candidatus Dojkabacteria bacterium]|nr:hypothetical protein [Candidatus Dojkabacteria bacterium]